MRFEFMLTSRYIGFAITLLYVHQGGCNLGEANKSL